MNDIMKKKIYFAKMKLLYRKYSYEGKITSFDDEIFELMKGTIVACLPVYLYIKYSKYLFARGTCHDRSLYMFLALDDAFWVHGDNKDLEYLYGKEGACHSWIERGDYVYDPSLMLRFDKDVYYKLYCPCEIIKTDKDTYVKEHSSFIFDNSTRNFDDFRPGGIRRHQLGILIEFTKNIAKYSQNEDFIKELNEYLETVLYVKDENLEDAWKLLFPGMKNK